MPDWLSIAAQLDLAGIDVSAKSVPEPVRGGDISAAWRLATTSGDVFIKTGPGSVTDAFAAEAEGLAEILATDTVRVPRVVSVGGDASGVFLALEWLQLDAGNEAVESRLGEQLANLHAVTRRQFGWHRDNVIGLTPQSNTPSDDWVSFFRERRLGSQLKLAAANGFGGALQDRGAQLLKRLPAYFDAVETDVSLLHGDLWGGNWATCGGEPVIYDPAVYYGDREADIAMTRLFGGFGRAFYDAYESRWPQREGYRERQHLYQLYHVLNHLNLFGSSYLGRATSLIDKLL